MKLARFGRNKVLVSANQAALLIGNPDYCLIIIKTALPQLGNAMLGSTRKVCAVSKLGETLEYKSLSNSSNQRLAIVMNSTFALSWAIIWHIQTTVSVTVTLLVSK